MPAAARSVPTLVWFLLAPLGAPVPSHAQAPTSQTYRLPKEEVRLGADGRATVLAARSVAVLADSRPLIRRDGTRVVVSYVSGRVGPGKAKADVEMALTEWGRFSVVSEAAEADLVLVIVEETLPPNLLSDGRLRLGHTLGVVATRGPTTGLLWLGTTTDGGLVSAFRSPSASRVVDEFREEVEKASRSGN